MWLQLIVKVGSDSRQKCINIDQHETDIIPQIHSPKSNYVHFNSKRVMTDYKSNQSLIS